MAKGCDIPDIDETVIYGVPPSILVMMQRGGRAGRDPNRKSTMSIIIERSVFKIQKIRDKSKKTKKTKSTPAAMVVTGNKTAGSSSQPSADGGKKAKATKSDVITSFDPNRTALPEGYEWVKKVDPIVRAFLSWKGCRRDFLDDYFENPPTREPHECFCIMSHPSDC